MKAAYIALLGLTACATTGDSDQADEQDSSGTSYAFIEDQTGNYDAWFAIQRQLSANFDDVCGDTFCGSDYSDVQALDLGCSVTKSTGNVKACTWNFGGSFAQINKVGGLAVTSKTWSCPVAVHGTIGQMTTILTGTGTDNPIQRPLPGGTSAYDSIAGCVVR